MSWTDYKRLIETCNTDPAAWQSAAQGNPNDPLTACKQAVLEAGPWPVAELLLTFARNLGAADETITGLRLALEEAAQKEAEGDDYDFLCPNCGIAGSIMVAEDGSEWWACGRCGATWAAGDGGQEVTE